MTKDTAARGAISDASAKQEVRPAAGLAAIRELAGGAPSDASLKDAVRPVAGTAAIRAL